MTVVHRILCGGIFHEFEETSAILRETLAPLGIESTVHDDPEDLKAALADADLLTVNALRWRMQGEKYDPYRATWAYSPSPTLRDAIEAFVAEGGGVLALHTAVICFDDWAGWGDLLGARWVWGRSHHPPPENFRIERSEVAHPIADGVTAFPIDDERYTDLDVAPDVAPLFTSDAASGHQPLVWACSRGRGRVVCDLLGHDRRSFLDPTHARLLLRAALWALGRADDEGRKT